MERVEIMAQRLLTGWPDERLLREAIRRISRIVDDEDVEEFYIGRTNDLAATQSRHGADGIIAIYETSSTQNAITMEESLIAAFWNYPENSNDQLHGGGGTSSDYFQYAYVAIWYY